MLPKVIHSLNEADCSCFCHQDPVGDDVISPLVSTFDFCNTSSRLFELTLTHSAPVAMSDAGSEPQRSKDVKDVHLVLLLHGLYGSPANLWCLEEEIRKAHYGDDTEDEEKRTAKDAPELDLVVLNAKSYSAAMTWDGIDVNAHRVSEEVSLTSD